MAWSRPWPRTRGLWARPGGRTTCGRGTVEPATWIGSRQTCIGAWGRAGQRTDPACGGSRTPSRPGCRRATAQRSPPGTDGCALRGSLGRRWRRHQPARSLRVRSGRPPEPSPCRSRRRSGAQMPPGQRLPSVRSQACRPQRSLSIAGTWGIATQGRAVLVAGTNRAPPGLAKMRSIRFPG